MKINIFSNQVLLMSIDYLFQFIQMKMTIKRLKTKRHYLPKGVVNTYNAIINEKNFYDQPID